MKKKEEHLEKQMGEVMSENRRLADPLQKANNEVDELRRQLVSYEKDKQLLAVSEFLCRFSWRSILIMYFYHLLKILLTCSF